MINVNGCFNCSQSMPSNTTPGSNGITYEFYIKYFDLIKDLLCLQLITLGKLENSPLHRNKLL